MKTIHATVNPRILSKADRLFTGTLAGRITEILQNARRAGAKKATITNTSGGIVTVHDDGRGIDDFDKLLDLGGSGWSEKLESSEDPAGVGLFCLSPRRLTIRSAGQVMTITPDAWHGKVPVELRKDSSSDKVSRGAQMTFEDEPWLSQIVSPLAVFSGMEVSVDGELCHQEPFIKGESALYEELGCRIQVMEGNALGQEHRSAARNSSNTLYWGSGGMLLNFHGQVLGLDRKPVPSRSLAYLVDMTGQPTDIHLMLPARTQMVENPAYHMLMAALELEGYRYIKAQGSHRLPYKEYLRARELGIELSEAEPVFSVGLLSGDDPPPVEVEKPRDFPLSKCYRFADCVGDDVDSNESDEANAHLLAALGDFAEPFVPVRINDVYDGYSWAKLPAIGKVQVTAGKILLEGSAGGGDIFCVESLSITAHCGDGRMFRSAVCLAVKPDDRQNDLGWKANKIYLTPAAESELDATAIWHHQGGFDNDASDSDSYYTQENRFIEELDFIFQQLHGPQEPLRVSLMECLGQLKDWKSVTIHPDGSVELVLNNGQQQTLSPPKKGEAR